MTHSQTMSDGMVEITQADRAAAHTWWMHREHDERDLPAYFARHREAAAAEERAKIVGYAQGHGGNAWSRDVLYFAEKIEAKEHLK